MSTIQDYIDSLNRDKESLVENLTTKGVSASDSETFTTLVPKVLDITSVNNQSKSETITSNTTTTITPDEGYTGLSSVSITTNVEADMSEFFASSISGGSSSSGYLQNLVKKIPSNITISGTTLQYAFAYAKELISVPLLDTSNVTNMNAMFYSCSKLESIPQLNTSNVTNLGSFVQACINMKNIPLLNTSNVTTMQFFALGDLSLTDTSLDNILQMCINTTSAYTRAKTLNELGINNATYYPASRIEALPHYQDFINAGWTIGY